MFPKIRAINIPGVRKLLKSAAPDAFFKKTAVKTVARFGSSVFPGGRKQITDIDVIRKLIRSGGSRKTAVKKQKIHRNTLMRRARRIAQLPYETLAKYAKQLNTTVEKILNVCADKNSRKGITHIDVIEALIEAGENRTAAAEKLKIHTGTLSRHVKNIRQLPDAALKSYAKALNMPVARIKELCADLTRAKGLTNLDIINALLETGGNRAAAAKKLKIRRQGVIKHARRIAQLPDSVLNNYAKTLRTDIQRIKDICAPLERAKKNIFAK